MDVIYDLLPFLIVAAVLGIAWLVFRNRATALRNGVDEFIGKGRPVVMRFFKNT